MQYETHSGTEHILQGHNDDFTNDLFYEGKHYSLWHCLICISCVDKLNFFELYNSVLAVNEAAPHLQLGPTISSLEQKYEAMLAQNEEYLSLSQEKYEPKFLEDEDLKEELGQLHDPRDEESK